MSHANSTRIHRLDTVAVLPGRVGMAEGRKERAVSSRNGLPVQQLPLKRALIEGDAP